MVAQKGNLWITMKHKITLIMLKKILPVLTIISWQLTQKIIIQAPITDKTNSFTLAAT